MALISYNQIQDQTPANANSINSRFAVVYGAINGNIDQENIKNGAITREKIANGSINKDKLDIKKYVDANGWTVTDMGGVKTYSRTVAVDGTAWDGNGGQGSQGFLIPGNGEREFIDTIKTPEGRTTNDITLVGTYFGNYAGHLLVSGQMVGTDQIMIAAGNVWGQKLAFRGKIFLQATEQV